MGLLIVYSLAIISVSILGGMLPKILNLTHTRTHIMMSFVAGFILGTAIYHLLPKSLHMTNNTQDVMWYMMSGIITMVLLLRFFHFHEREHHSLKDKSAISWPAIAIGMVVCSTMEGLALGTSIKSDLSHGNSLAGLGVFLIILFHKPLDALSITGTMQGSKKQTLVNVAFALVCPAIAILTFWGIGTFTAAKEPLIGKILAFATGVFLCSALSDLLPEIHHHKHDRIKLSLAFLLGVFISYAIYLLENLPTFSHD